MTAGITPEARGKTRRRCSGNIVREDCERRTTISYAEAALIAGVSLSTIYYWVSRGRRTKARAARLPLVARRGAFRIARTDLDRFLRKA